MTTDLFEDHRAIVSLSEEVLALVRRTPRPTVEELTQARARLGSRRAASAR